MIATASFYTIMDIEYITAWQYLVLLVLGFSVYLNLLLIIKLMQTVRVSMVMGVMSGIIIISATTFNSINDYVACLTIILSILVLLKIEYLDKNWYCIPPLIIYFIYVYYRYLTLSIIIWITPCINPFQWIPVIQAHHGLACKRYHLAILFCSRKHIQDFKTALKCRR